MCAYPTCYPKHTYFFIWPKHKTSSPMGNDRSPESKHNMFYNVQRQVTLDLKQRSGLISNNRYYACSAYLQVLKRSELK